MDQQLRTVFRGLAAMGTPNLVQFIKDAVPLMSQEERNTLRRELDRANDANRTVSILVDTPEGYYNVEQKRICDCTDDELRLMLQRGRSKRKARMMRAELKRRKRV